MMDGPAGGIGLRDLITTIDLVCIAPNEMRI